MNQPPDDQPTSRSHRTDEPHESPEPALPDQPAAGGPHAHPDEDLISGSEGSGRNVGLGGGQHRDRGSAARPMWDGH